MRVTMKPQARFRKWGAVFQLLSLMLPAGASCEGLNWSIGGYAGRYYDSEPAGLLNRRANFLNQYIVALTASRTVWRSETLALSLELDGTVAQQFGVAALSEIAVAPVVRWSRFPWNEALQTDLRIGPIGASYTTTVSPLERGQNDQGSRTLNFLLIEVAFSRPGLKSEELFVRLHHRCSLYDLLNHYGANGEDFLALGFRRFF